MKNIISLFGIAIIILSIYSCKSNPAEPPIITPIEVKPGSRNYTWEEFVLTAPQNEIISLWTIWGANTSDIWAVGDCSSAYLGTWHYNGSQFTNIVNTNTSGQSSIWGSATNDIWMGSGGGIVWHYNGSEWVFNIALKYRNYTKFAIQDIWGVSSNEVYAVGAKLAGDVDDKTFGAVFKYDGLNWKDVGITETNLDFLGIAKDKDGDLIIKAIDDKNFQASILSWDGSKLKELFPPTSLGSTGLICQDGNVYVERNKILYKYKNGTFVLFKDFTGTNMYSLKCMRNEKDIFYGYKDGSTYGLAHYNGTDSKLLYETSPYFYPSTGQLFEKDVFFILFDNIHLKTKILHGKLTE
jgi:hypothetical protein